MRFGVFDHLDDSGLPLGRHFEERLRLIEAYDRAGFYGYHLAEHHNTPLGYAPSPASFSSAVAQRTKRLRFGPMVYLLPLYHPLRLIDEICMLDQMSGGRFLYGVGRGISPIEVGFYGVDFDTGMQQFREAFDAIRIGLTEDELTYHGKFYDFDHVPIVMKPVQKPYPELWYGTSRPDSIPWAAEHGAHIVTLRDTTQARAIIELYKAEWRKRGRPEAELPMMGINRHIVARRDRGRGARHRPTRLPAVAPAHGAAVGEIRRAVPVEGRAARGMGSAAGAWARHCRHAGAGARLHRRRRPRPPARPISCAISRSARSRHEDAIKSVELFAREVMPAFADA